MSNRLQRNGIYVNEDATRQVMGRAGYVNQYTESAAEGGGATLTGLAMSMGLGVLTPSTPSLSRAYLSWVSLELPVGGQGGAVTWPLTGNEMTTAVGTLTPTVTRPIVGFGITTSVGSPQGVEGTVQALTGAAMTASLGTVGIGRGADLTGFDITTTVGDLGVSLIECIASVGTLTPAIERSLSGYEATMSVGQLSPQITSDQEGTLAGLTGFTAAMSVGTLTPSIAVDLTTDEITTGVGEFAFGDSVEVALTGFDITMSLGSMTLPWVAVGPGSGTWTPTTPAGGTWTPT